MKYKFLDMEIQFGAEDDNILCLFQAKIGDLRPNLYALLVVNTFSVIHMTSIFSDFPTNYQKTQKCKTFVN